MAKIVIEKETGLDFEELRGSVEGMLSEIETRWFSGQEISQARKHYDTFTAGNELMDKEERPIAVDIFKTEKKMRVVAELPGLNEKDIRLDLNEDTLTISASRGKRSYYKNVRLPRVCRNIIGKMYNTGILEVTLN